MRKKRRRRRKRPSNPFKTDEEKLKEFREFAKGATARVMFDGVRQDHLLEDIGGMAREHAKTFKYPEILEPSYFFASPYGDIALESVRIVVEPIHDILVENDLDDTRWKGIRFDGASREEMLSEAMALSRAASYWGLLSMLSNKKKIRGKPYENEHIFKFYSEAMPRYQFIYRYLEKYHSEALNRRYAITRMLSSTAQNERDKEEDKFVSHLLTELWMSGNNEFEIRSDLRDMFLHTDIGNLKASEVKFPYPAFHVETGSTHYMFSNVVLSSGERIWTMQNLQRGSVQLAEVPQDNPTLKELWEAVPEGMWDGADEEKQACKEAFQMVCNLCLYLECKDAEFRSSRPETGSPPDAKKHRELKEHTKKTYIPARHVLYPSLEKTSSRSSEGSERKQHWVRGHYRWQAYWPEGRDGQKVNKRIWIEPHLRGSKTEDDKQQEPRTYRV